MLSRFMYETMFASGSDRTSPICTAVAGVTPTRTCPSTCTPAFRSDASSAPAANAGGSCTTREYRRGAERAPIVPLTVMPLAVRRAMIRPPLPPVTETLLVSGIAVLAGSSSTTALPPTARATIQTRFSFNESADTGAAYEDTMSPRI